MTKDIDQTIGLEPTGRVCTKCNTWKPFSAYHTVRRRDGTRKPVARCKECVNEIKREHARANSASAVERVRQWRLLPGNKERKNELERERRKNPEIREKINEYNKEWRSRPEVRERRNAAKRKRRKEDPAFRDKDLSYKQEYYGRPEIREAIRRNRMHGPKAREIKDKFNSRRRERYATEPDFFCAVQCRGFVIRTARKAKTNKDASTETSLGYSPKQLRLRIECQFKPGMSWENHGEWHIDHKKPISAFIAQGVTDPKTINALCNLQPMWGEENIAKGGSWPTTAANDNERGEYEKKSG
jgi:hypothetical protein